MRRISSDGTGATLAPTLVAEIVSRIRALSSLRWGSERIADELGVARNAARRSLRGGEAVQRQVRRGA